MAKYIALWGRLRKGRILTLLVSLALAVYIPLHIDVGQPQVLAAASKKTTTVQTMPFTGQVSTATNAVTTVPSDTSTAPVTTGTSTSASNPATNTQPAQPPVEPGITTVTTAPEIVPEPSYPPIVYDPPPIRACFPPGPPYPQLTDSMIMWCKYQYAD